MPITTDDFPTTKKQAPTKKAGDKKADETDKGSVLDRGNRDYPDAEETPERVGDALERGTRTAGADPKPPRK